MKMNYQLFNSFYADHLLNEKGILYNETNEKRAEKLVYLAFRDKYPEYYLERYIYVYLEIKVKNLQHLEAVKFLIKNKQFLTGKYRKKYLTVFRKLNKIVAKEYFITANFCNKQYLVCHDQLILLRKNANINFLKVFSSLRKEANKNQNPYAMAIMGKLFKDGKYMMRDLKTAVKYFKNSAQYKCPDGYYYLGKEYYHGRILKRSYEKAKENFINAMKHFGEPRAGYYLYQIGKKIDVEKDIEYLKEAASFGYKKALYEYGLLLVSDTSKKENEEDGKNYILLSAKQNYKKAIKYCKNNGIEIADKNTDKDVYARLGSQKFDIKFSDDDDDLGIDDNLIAKVTNKIKSTKASKLNVNSNNAVFKNTNEDIINLEFLIGSTKSNKKINPDDDEPDSNLNQSTNNPKKVKKSTSIIIDDNDKNNSDLDNSEKEKKSSDLPESKKDKKHAKNKVSDLNSNENSDDSDDSYQFWAGI